MRYCIKEFASLLGLTVDTLRLYEKHEIVSPFKDERNNYRYFDDLDARGLLMSRWYRSLGIPLQEAADLMKEGTLEHAADAVRSTREHLEEELRRSARLLEKLNVIENELAGLGERLFHCTLRQMPGFYRLKQTEQNRLLHHDELKHAAGEWMDRLPFAFYSFRIEPEELTRTARKHDPFDHSWGLALEEEDYTQAGFDFDQEGVNRIDYVAPAICLSAVIASMDHTVLQRGTLEFMLERLRQHGITAKQGAFGRLLLTEKVAGGRRSYIEVHIPITDSDAQKLNSEQKVIKTHH